MKDLFELKRQELKAVIKFVETSPYSDFYKHKYAKKYSAEINNYTDFQKIPLLNKEEILNVPADRRAFVPIDEIKRYSFSSGTTNSGKPLITPHADDDFKSESMSESKAHQIGVNRLLVLLAPFSPLKIKIFSTYKNEIIPIAGNVSDLKLTALMSKNLKIDGIYSTPTILYYFIDRLKEIDFNFNCVKYITVGGELCTKEKLSYFKAQFPNAKILLRYSTTETSSNIGYQCDFLAGKSSTEYHPTIKGFIEILDPENNSLPAGKVGEIVYTTTEIRAFPLIRYKLADVGSITKGNCSCGNSYLLKLGGRDNYDILRFHEVILYAQLIDKALEETNNIIYPAFQMHVYEKSVNGKLMPHLILKVQLRNKDKQSVFTKKLIQESVSRRLYLSADKTLKYFVDNKIFLPLEIDFTEWPQTDRKHRNIVSHLE